MKYLILVFMWAFLSCMNVTTPEGQHQLGRIIASAYKYSEGSVPEEYRKSAELAYHALTLVTAESSTNDLEYIYSVMDRYVAEKQIPDEVVALAKVTFSQVYARAKLNKVSSRMRLQRLRHIKAGIDSIIN